MNIFAAGARFAKVICWQFGIPTRDARFASFIYPREADIVGRVTGVGMRLAESPP